MTLHRKRALRNSALLTLVVGALGLYQAESLQVILMSCALSFPILYFALYSSYKFSEKLMTQKMDNNSTNPPTSSKN